MTVLAELEPYGSQAEVLKANIERIQALFPTASLSGDYLYSAKGLVNIEDLMEFTTSTGLKATIHPHKGNIFFSKQADFEKRLEDLTGDMKLIRQQLVVDGTIVQVHVPNFYMLSLNEVKVLDSACTDELQGELNKGWRILCVCPPLNERRPTYILGRYTPDQDTKDAKQGCSR